MLVGDECLGAEWAEVTPHLEQMRPFAGRVLQLLRRRRFFITGSGPWIASKLSFRQLCNIAADEMPLQFQVDRFHFHKLVFPKSNQAALLHYETTTTKQTKLRRQVHVVSCSSRWR